MDMRNNFHAGVNTTWHSVLFDHKKTMLFSIENFSGAKHVGKVLIIIIILCLIMLFSLFTETGLNKHEFCEEGVGVGRAMEGMRMLDGNECSNILLYETKAGKSDSSQFPIQVSLKVFSSHGYSFHACLLISFELNFEVLSCMKIYSYGKLILAVTYD